MQVRAKIKGIVRVTARLCETSEIIKDGDSVQGQSNLSRIIMAKKH